MPKPEIATPAVIREIDDLISQLRDQSQVIPFDYLILQISSAARHLPDCTFFVSRPKLFHKKEEFRPDIRILLFPYLTFSVRSGNIMRFQGANALEDVYLAYDQFGSGNVAPNFRTSFVLVYRANGTQHHIQARLEAQVAQLLDLYVVLYEYDKLLVKSAISFSRSLDRDDRSNSLLGDLQLIAELYEANVAYVTIAKPGAKVLFGQERAIFHTRFFLAKYNYALTLGVPVDCYLRFLGIDYFFTLVPNSAWHIDRRLPPGCTCIINAGSYVRSQIVRFVAQVMAKREREQIASRQSAVLETLASMQRSLVEDFRSGAYDSRSKRLTTLRLKLSSVCEQVASALGAHSMTIRLHNSFEQTLDTIAFFDRSGIYNPSAQGSEISVHDVSQSLNAAVFRVRPPFSPVRIDDIGKPDLPADLVAIGFISPLRRRETTVSEICSSIWYRGLPIGVLNLESRQKRGFLRDDVFVSTVAQHLGDLIALANEAVSFSTIVKIANISEAAHGAAALDSLDSLTELSLPENVRSLLASFVEFLRIYRSGEPTDDRRLVPVAELVARISKLYQDNTVPMIMSPHSGRFDVRWDDREVNSRLADAIVRVCGIVFRNACKHSVLNDDDVGIELANRGAFGGGWTFRLEYRSSAVISPAVLDLFGLVPIERRQTTRYGAFLLGYQVRALGGLLNVRGRGLTVDLSCLQLEILIPLEPYNDPTSHSRD